MKISFSPKQKLIKLAEDDRQCRLCGIRGEHPGSVAVIPYSLTGEPTANKNRKRTVSGCTTCNNTGKVSSEPPSFTECKTCKPNTITARGIGRGPGIFQPRICPGCNNKGTITVPSYGGAEDDVKERPCRTCHGNPENIPVKECPSCIGQGSDKPGFVQHGESQHHVICPTCNGSKKRTIIEPYTPILQVKCPHDHVDTRTKPAAENATDKLGAYDKNYFEGQRLIPLRLFGAMQNIKLKYKMQTDDNIDLTDFNAETRKIGKAGETREIGVLSPPVPPVPNSEEPSYMDFVTKTHLLDPDRPNRNRNASNLFKKIKISFNSKTARPNNSEETSNELGDDFFGGLEQSSSSDDDLKDFLPEGFSVDTKDPSKKRVINPEESKRLHGGPITTRQIDESDMKRPFLKNPARALEHTKSMLHDQKSLSEKRKRMSKMYKGISAIDDEPDENVREQKRNEGLRPSYRNWRDNLQAVSENLDYFGQLRSSLRKKLAPVIGKNMEPEIATALTSQQFREGKVIKNKQDGSVLDLSKHRMGITDPMPYFKNDENWRETHSGLGCDHDPGEGHEPDVGCLIDYSNSPSNPKSGVTTGINSRLVTGKYTRDDGKTILQTVGARLKRPTESGLAKQDLRGSTPQWTPESFGRTVELPSDNATCVPNKIQREHYVVNHTIEPASERAETTQLSSEETGIQGLKPEPILNKEKVKFQNIFVRVVQKNLYMLEIHYIN